MHAGAAPEIDQEGFELPRRKDRRRHSRRAAAQDPPRPRSPSAEEAAGLCFLCLDLRHRVRDCTGDGRAAGAAAHHGDHHTVAAPPMETPDRPETSSTPVRVILARSVEMEETEGVLHRAMVATIIGTRPAVSAKEVSELLCASLDMHPGDFSVHLHRPEDFLIVLASRELKDRLAGDHFISGPRFSLSLRPWCKLAHVGSARLTYRVEIELRGIPADAWHLSTEEHILGSSYWIKRLHPSTRSRADLATFRLSARTMDPANIRRHAILEIVEMHPSRHQSDAPAISTLSYPVSVMLARAELDAPAPCSVTRADDPDGGQGGDHERHDNDPARCACQRRRGRKRRRTSSTPADRADGMQMDDLPWPLNPQHRHGGWLDLRR
uniref:DUF4283 domain-containing protein n=1 Tax=Hordeum vulgare subsp. vulgare TaxID=112509 RepID=A0A8I6X0X7_HORVV